MLRPIIIILILFSTSACFGPKIIDTRNYQHVDIPKNSNPPTVAQLKGKLTRVIVYETEDKASRAKLINLGQASTGAIENFVGASAELIDRSLAGKLIEEIKLLEVKGNGSYSGENVADFAVLSDITLAKVGSKFTDAYTYEHKGKLIRVGSTCAYTANVNGNLKVYSLPSLKLKKLIKLEGSDRVSEDASRCYNSKSRDDGLLESSAVDGVKDARAELQNVFAAKGYITERRSGKDGSIFKITLGSERGAKKGAKVEMQREKFVTNSLTGESESEVINLGKGEISDKVEAKYSWVYVGDKETADNLKLGDTVTIFHKKSFMEIVKGL